MLYPRKNDGKLEKDLFENPGSEYRGTPFWAWNCRVTKELIKDQLGVFKKMGFGGAHLHPRTGLDNAYMGKEYMELVRFANETAKEKDMLTWLYDEDRYPSGSAGGMVTENLNFRSRHLLFTRERKEGMSGSWKEFQEEVKAGKKPAGYYLTAYRIRTENGYLCSSKRIEEEQPDWGSAEAVTEEGRLWLVYAELMRESPWYNDQTYVDVMNQKAIEKFLELTHEKYYEELGEEFGKSIPAIFTDEPQMRGSMALPDGDADFDVTLPFTDDLPETFEKCYGYSLLDVLPEILWELPKGRGAVSRWHYYDHLSEQFVSSFSDTIAEWCQEHGIAMTGHYMSEPTLYSQTLRLGEAMRCYRSQQIPGVDILCGDPEYSTIKQAVSVARQKGRDAVISEMYGVTNWDFDFKGHKVQGDWQAALGVTVRCPHLSFMSMEGEAKRDWPASIHYQSPWYEHYSYIEDYFARVATAMTRGKADVKVGVIHPIESYWISYGPVAQTQEQRDQLDQQYKELIEWLLFGLIDFDLISESMLAAEPMPVSGSMPEPVPVSGSVPEPVTVSGSMPEPVPVSGSMPASEPALERKERQEGSRPVFKVGEMAYQTIIVPGLRTIRSSTLKRLEAFAAAGGQVIFAGEIPGLEDAAPSGRAFKLAEASKVTAFNRREILEALECDRSLEIRCRDGRRTENLFYQMRQDGEEHWLFVCHVKEQKYRADQAEELKVRIRGEYSVTCYDAQSGRIYPMEASVENGWTSLDVTLYAQDSFLWKLGRTDKDKADKPEDKYTGESFPAAHMKVGIGPCAPGYGLVAGWSGQSVKPYQVLQTIEKPVSFKLAEKNVLLLDKAAWQLDDGQMHSPQEILRLDNEIRSVLHYPRRQDAYKQPWRIPDTPKEHVVTLRYEIDSEVDTAPLHLAMERPEDAHIHWNGREIPSEAVPGSYYVDSFIREVEVPPLVRGKNELVLKIPFGRKTNLESLYLLGDFGVEVRGTEAKVTEYPTGLYFGDITRQKLPFYGGNVIYRMEFELAEEKEILVRVPHFSAPVLEVFVDGSSAGLIAFAPHIIETGRQKAGKHTLEICSYGNRFNTFGMLHNCNPEYKWYGPDSYRTSGSEWSESWCLRPAGILSRVEILEPSGSWPETCCKNA